MITGNYFSDNQGLLSHFNKLIDWEPIIKARELNYKDHQEYEKTGNEQLAFAPKNAQEAIETYRIFLETVGDLSGNHVAPNAAQMDKEGLRFDKGKVIFPQLMISFYEKAKEAGIIPYGISRAHGGLHLPITIQNMFVEIMSRADSSSSLCIGVANISEIIEMYGDDALANEWVSKIAAGELSCAMALTEPDYGSDLSNIQTKAHKDEKGQWRLTGSKRFITHGCGFADIPAAILTLARTGSPDSGARGLSFFIVKSTDTEIGSIEKKMGIHCSPTCEVIYDQAPAILIGKEGYGLTRYSIGMMNGARLVISAQSLGVAQAASEEAHKYASERQQFGVALQDITAVSKILRRMRRELLGMRCLLYEAARLVDLYTWSKQDDEKKARQGTKPQPNIENRKLEKLANFFTPLAKYYNSEMCNTLANDALQIHGGAGYTEDYDVARIYRDARITTIYEGTTQLQVVAIIGGISAGMTESGYLKQYIGKQLERIPNGGSSALVNLYTDFQKVCTDFQSIKDKSTREEISFEVVESAARFIISMLLEVSLTKLSQEEQGEYNELKEAFHIDSQAIITANHIRIGSISKMVKAEGIKEKSEKSKEASLAR